MDLMIEVGLIDHSSVIASTSYQTCHGVQRQERHSHGFGLHELFSTLVPSLPFLVFYLVASLIFFLSAFLFSTTIKKCFNAPNQIRAQNRIHAHNRIHARSQIPAQSQFHAPNQIHARSQINRRTTAEQPLFRFGFGSFVASQFPERIKLLKRSGVAKILLLAYVLFMFLIRTMLSMNIKTNKIIVNTAELIHSEESLRATKKTPCFLGMKLSTKSQSILISTMKPNDKLLLQRTAERWTFL